MEDHSGLDANGERATHLKVHILFPFVDGPWGGANQFLKALRSYLVEARQYADDPQLADTIILNGHHSADCLYGSLLSLKRRNPELVVVHRLDGSATLARGRDDGVDGIVFLLNRLWADGTVFQSAWSRESLVRLGLKPPRRSIVIPNAPDPRLFHSGAPSGEPTSERPTRLIATSWSDNPRKGFDVYQYLDEHLDFARFEMTFVGNSPVRFNRIRHLRPLPSNELAEELRRHHVYIIASKIDACSNALIEALHCGLPAVVINGPGHIEIAGQAGVAFSGKEDVMAAIELAARRRTELARNINLPHIEEVVRGYETFMAALHADVRLGKLAPQATSVPLYLELLWRLARNMLRDRARKRVGSHRAPA